MSQTLLVNSHLQDYHGTDPGKVIRNPPIQPTLQEMKRIGLGIGPNESVSSSHTRRATAFARPSATTRDHFGNSAFPQDAATPVFELPPTPPSDLLLGKEWHGDAVVVSPELNPVQTRPIPSPRSDSPPAVITMPAFETEEKRPLIRAETSSEASAVHSWLYGAREINSLGELPYLNGIRALATIMIQIHHIYEEDTRYTNFFASAALATHFVQGGFLITSSLLVLQSRSRRRGWSHMHEHVPQFFLGRWVRLYPALLVIIAINSIWWLKRHDMPMHLAKLITRSMLKIQHTSILDVGDDPPNPFAHTWFLDVQEHFYLFWSLALPFIVMLPGIGRLAVLGSLFGWSMRKRLKIDRANATLRINMYKMVAGCAVQLIPFPRALIHPYVRVFTAIALAFFLAYGFSPRLNDGTSNEYQRFYGDNAGVALTTLLTLAGISKKQETVDEKARAARGEVANEKEAKLDPTCANQGPRVSYAASDDDQDFLHSLHRWTSKLDFLSPLNLLNTQALQFVGRVSYSWYLWQVPLMHFEDTFHVGNKAIGTSSEAFIAALISTFYIEEPIRNYFQAWRKRQRAAAPLKPAISVTNIGRKE